MWTPLRDTGETRTRTSILRPYTPYLVLGLPTVLTAIHIFIYYVVSPFGEPLLEPTLFVRHAPFITHDLFFVTLSLVVPLWIYRLRRQHAFKLTAKHLAMVVHANVSKEESQRVRSSLASGGVTPSQRGSNHVTKEGGRRRAFAKAAQVAPASPLVSFSPPAATSPPPLPQIEPL